MKVLLICLVACAAMMAFAYDAEAAIGYNVTPGTGYAGQWQFYTLKITGLTPGVNYKVKIVTGGQTTIYDASVAADANGEITYTRYWSWQSAASYVSTMTVERADGTTTQTDITAVININ